MEKIGPDHGYDTSTLHYQITVSNPGANVGGGLASFKNSGDPAPTAVTLSVEGIGTLTNEVVAGVEPVPLPVARPGRLRDRAARPAR